MMHKAYAVLLILTVSIFILTQSCNEIAHASRHGTARSHLAGVSCMSCHSEKGPTKNIFTVAGTVLNEGRNGIQSHAIIKLYTQKKGQGDLIAQLQTDEHGNFYTTQKIDFSKGLYPTLLGTPGAKEDTKHMNKAIFTGNCSSCHGPSAELIGID